MIDPSTTIKLDQFLKWSNAAQTGGEAKVLIQSGQVRVNGEIETRRGRKLVEGDWVSVRGQTLVVGDLQNHGRGDDLGDEAER